jgi:selenoprotein W-related protein
LLRATWISQELLTTFESEIDELTLVPGTGGVFNIYANNNLIWSRKEQGRFAELKELKQRIRDVIAPEKNLGHSDEK